MSGLQTVDRGQAGGRSRERANVQSAAGETWIVSSMAISWIVFACVFGGALFGNFLRAVLPEHHLSTESKDVVKLGMGLIATMTALVLGLLIATAKDSYDTQRSGL